MRKVNHFFLSIYNDRTAPANNEMRKIFLSQAGVQSRPVVPVEIQYVRSYNCSPFSPLSSKWTPSLNCYMWEIWGIWGRKGEAELRLNIFSIYMTPAPFLNLPRIFTKCPHKMLLYYFWKDWVVLFFFFFWYILMRAFWMLKSAICAELLNRFISVLRSLKWSDYGDLTWVPQ